MAKQRWKLTDAQWRKIEPLLPKLKKSKRGGRPWANNRKVFEGILWILRTGGTLGRFAKTIYKCFNMLAKAQGLGTTGYMAQRMEGISV